MSKAVFPAGTIMGAALMCVAIVGLVTAQTQSPPALTGKVTSHAEGAMEGVLVGARKTDSTIATWVVANAQGHYSFPRERLEPAHTRFASGRSGLTCRTRQSM